MHDRHGVVKLEVGVKPRLLIGQPCISILKKHVVAQLCVLFEQVGDDVLLIEGHLESTDDRHELLGREDGVG